MKWSGASCEYGGLYWFMGDKMIIVVIAALYDCVDTGVMGTCAPLKSR